MRPELENVCCTVADRQTTTRGGIGADHGDATIETRRVNSAQQSGVRLSRAVGPRPAHKDPFASAQRSGRGLLQHKAPLLLSLAYKSSPLLLSPSTPASLSPYPIQIYRSPLFYRLQRPCLPAPTLLVTVDVAAPPSVARLPSAAEVEAALPLAVALQGYPTLVLTSLPLVSRGTRSGRAAAPRRSGLITLK